MHQIIYLLLCAVFIVLRDCYGVVTSYTISYDDLWHTCFGCNAAIAYLYEWGILFHSIWYPHLPETNHNISMIKSTIMMYDRQFLSLLRIKLYPRHILETYFLDTLDGLAEVHQRSNCVCIRRQVENVDRCKLWNFTISWMHSSMIQLYFNSAVSIFPTFPTSLQGIG